MKTSMNFAVAKEAADGFISSAKVLSAQLQKIKSVQSSASALDFSWNIRSLIKTAIIDTSQSISALSSLQATLIQGLNKYRLCESSLCEPNGNHEALLKEISSSPTGNRNLNWDNLQGKIDSLGFVGSLATSITGSGSNKTTHESVASQESHDDSDVSGSKNVWSGQNVTGSTVTDLGVLGYKKDDDGTTGYLLDLQGHSDDSLGIGGLTAVSTVGLTIGAARGTVDASFTPFSASKKSEAKEGAKYNSADSSNMYGGMTEQDGTVKSDTSADLVNWKVAAEVGVTAAVLDYHTTIGTEDISGTVDANAKLLDADLGASFDVGVGEDGLTAKVKCEAGASLAEVETSASINIKGVEAKTKVSAEVGVGIYGEFGYDSDSGELTVGFGASLGIGGKIKFSIKVPNLGLPWW